MRYMTAMVFQKGNKVWLGKHLSEETKNKIRFSKLGDKNPMYGKFGDKNPMYGKHRIMSEKTKEKMRTNHADFSGKNNPNWKGDDIGYIGLHNWINRHLIKPDLCELCGKEPTYDWANTTGVYDRDLENWECMCRSCHMKYDYEKGFRKCRGK